MRQIVECIPNFSEGRNPKTIREIFRAAQNVKGVKVFGLEHNEDHNRCLFTILGTPEKVLLSVFEAIRVATKRINMEKHHGEHPRIGATDVVPFVPVVGVSMKDCVRLAKKLAVMVSSKLRVPVYLYGAAATRKDRFDLADVRRGEYEALKLDIGVVKARKPDYGRNVMHPTAGATIIGARNYLIAFNVNLNTRSLVLGKRIASAIRERNGGLPGVKALCFKVGGYAQISMNLVDFEKTNFDEAFRAVEKLAARSRVRVRSAEIYGMVPLSALVRATRTTFNLTGFTNDQVLETKMYE